MRDGRDVVFLTPPLHSLRLLACKKAARLLGRVLGNRICFMTENTKLPNESVGMAKYP